VNGGMIEPVVESDETHDAVISEPIEGLKTPLVLVGLMGAGKSTIGRRLARRIGRRFVDSDEEIERAAACSISDIFAIHGEPIFRDLEQRVIFRLLDEEHLVLATGGGAWMQETIRKQIKKRALSVWLRADLDVLLERVERRNHRPLLETGDKRAILERLLQERYPIYAQADLTIDSGDGPHEIVVEHIISSLKAQMEMV
jgi:shikimate kinase